MGCRMVVLRKPSRRPAVVGCCAKRIPRIIVVDMLTPAQEKLLTHLTSKRGRREYGKCIIEGEKFVRDAGDLVEFTFTPQDTPRFTEFVSTETPQAIAAVARVPEWTIDDLASRETIIVLDGVQDPGNVGTILRACLGFGASLVLVESAEVTNPKTIRSSASAMLRVPWMTVSRADAPQMIGHLNRPIYRLEVTKEAVALQDIPAKPCIIIAGNEGAGITLPIRGTSVCIVIDPALESLNVGIATALALYERRRHV
jgi:RNA methyltransferase, TrmH family